VKTRRLKRSRRTSTLLWLCQGPRLWLTRRPEQGVWAGLWSLPEWPAACATGVGLPAWPGRWRALPPVEHALTHFDWTLQPLRWTLPQDLAESVRATIEDALGAGRWVTRDEALSMGLPAPVRRLLLEASGGPGDSPSAD
jgi:A/G-specific adenine glycosylase